MEKKRVLLMLSHVPIGTVVSIFDSPEQRNPLMGHFAGLGLLDGRDTIKVTTKGRQGAQLLLDDAIAIVIDLK